MTTVIRHPRAITELWPSTGELCTRLAAQERAREKALKRLAKLRKKAAAEITRLIAFLDASDPYVMNELEEQVDDGPIDEDELEPSFCGVTAEQRGPDLGGLGDELEADYGHGQDANDEPSLGSVAVGENVTQAAWSQGGSLDVEDEHDGAEPDVDAEPSLGWTTSGVLGGISDYERDDCDRESNEPLLTECV